MHKQDRREWGDGSLITRPNAKGGETWIAKWRIDGRSVTRSVGHKRSKAHPDGLTPSQAEAKFRRMRDEEQVKPERSKSGHSLREVGESLAAQMRLDGRRPATLEGLESTLRVHILPFFGEEAVAKIDPARVRSFNEVLGMKVTRRGGPLSPKSRRNVLVNLHQLFRHAIQLGWRTAENPVKHVKKPVSVHADGRIQHLEVAEVEALIQAVPNDVLGQAERPMYLTAAMTGLRQGELFALRWRDVDWAGRVIHVQENFVRGRFQSPKSRKVRHVPMAARVQSELERHYAATKFNSEQDLVFAHPELGTPIDRSRVSKRFRATVKRAGVGGFEPVIDAATGNQMVKPVVDPHTNRWVRDAQGVLVTEPITRPVIRFHDLRHTFATLIASNPEFTMQDVQEYMGHADLKTTLVYAHYRPKARAAALIDASFEETREPASEPTGDEPVERIARLADLHRQGVLDDDEFAAAKGRLIAQL